MFDSHAHVAFEQFDEDRAAVMARARQAGLAGWIEVGTDLAQSRRALALARQQKQVAAAVGVHPSDVAGLTEAVWRELEGLLDDEHVVAVGEVGLDYYRGGTKEGQLPALGRFVRLAYQRELPVIFHVRDGEMSAHDDLLTYLEKLADDERPTGVMHTFSGTREQAARYLELGLHLSFSGVVTFKNAEETVAVAKMAPLERVLIETDCPFLAPEPHRGERNEPAFVALVAEKLATLWGVPADVIRRATAENTRRLFKKMPQLSK
jgi:TatD DNase family protein